MELEEIISAIEVYAYKDDYKSALEVFKILNENKDKELHFVSESHWFTYNFTQLENLIYNDENTWNTEYFKKEYSNIIPKILYHLKKEH
jgi:hypothetical protein